jgi:hypothetical protein
VPTEARIHDDGDGFVNRKSVLLSYHDHDFAVAKIFVHIEALSVEGTSNDDEFEYRFFYTQPRLKLDLVIFFTVFFSSFYMFIFVFAPGIYLKVGDSSRPARSLARCQRLALHDASA